MNTYLSLTVNRASKTLTIKQERNNKFFEIESEVIEINEGSTEATFVMELFCIEASHNVLEGLDIQIEYLNQIRDLISTFLIYEPLKTRANFEMTEEGLYIQVDIPLTHPLITPHIKRLIKLRFK